MNEALPRRKVWNWPLLLPLLAALALSAQARAGRGDRGPAKLPRCLEAMQSESVLADYVTYLSSHRQVLDAFRPCQYPAEILDAFAAQLADAELTGLAPSTPLPQGYLETPVDRNWLILSQQEGFEIVAAKLAHILFVEVQGLVPWSIADYDDAALDTLFDVCSELGCSFGGRNKSPSFRFDYVADYSPRVVWELLDRSIDMDALVDPRSGISEIIGHARRFRHGSRDLDPDLGIVAVDEMAAEGVSRRGCWSMSPYLVALASALNIPGSQTYGYYAGGPHRSALFEAVDAVLAHGDDVYNGSLDNTPADLLLDSHRRWVDEVLRYDPLEGPSSPAGYNSRVHNYEMARLFPSHWTMARYCGEVSQVVPGRAFLESFFDGYATSAELDDLEVRILETTAGCAVIPPDAPDRGIASPAGPA